MGGGDNQQADEAGIHDLIAQFILGRGRNERPKRPNDICKRKMSGKDRK